MQQKSINAHSTWLNVQYINYFPIRRKRYINDKTYSDEFIEMTRSVEDLVRSAHEEDYINENDDQYKEILKKYYFIEPVFSDGWLRLFAKRNRFSWRVAHFACMGKSTRSMWNNTFVWSQKHFGNTEKT